MDADRLDSLARALAESWHRRALLRGLRGGAIGLAVWHHADPAGPAVAKNCKKIDDKKKRKRCRKKAKETNTGTSPPPSPPLTCAQTCTGCCNTSGVCQAGTTAATCGTGGEACVTCTGEEVCTGGDCVVPACGAGGPCRVFVTSTTQNGDLGGLSGADLLCQQLAGAASLPGIYRRLALHRGAVAGQQLHEIDRALPAPRRDDDRQQLQRSDRRRPRRADQRDGDRGRHQHRH